MKKKFDELREYMIRTVWDYYLEVDESDTDYIELYDWLNEFGMVDECRDQLAIYFFATKEGADALRDEMIKESQQLDSFEEPRLCHYKEGEQD